MRTLIEIMDAMKWKNLPFIALVLVLSSFAVSLKAQNYSGYNWLFGNSTYSYVYSLKLNSFFACNLVIIFLNQWCKQVSIHNVIYAAIYPPNVIYPDFINAFD